MHKYTLNKKSKKLTRNAHFYANGELLKKMNSKSSAAAKEAFSASNLGGSIGAIGGAIGTITSAALANAEVDTSKADNAIEAVNNYQPATHSLDALADSYNSMKLANTDWEGKDFSISTGKALANMGKAGLSGATAGAQVGGIWGAIGGLAAGLGASGAGWAVGSAKAKAEAERVNREAMLANTSATTRAEDARDDLQLSEYNNYRRNVAAKGGRIHTMKDNIFNNGGLMHQHGGIFSNGIVFIDNGGTHEQNPFEGVQLGVDNQGVPNLVEEGEVIWQDYVFSNRLKPTKEFKDKYKIKGETFADAANEMQKESEERVNDSISKRGLNDSMMKLMLEQEKVRSISKRSTPNNMFDKGGKKTSKSKSDTLDTSSMMNSMLEHDYYVNQLGYRSVEEGKRIERESKTQKAIEDITGTSAPLTLEDVFSVFRKDKKYKTGRNKNNKFAGGGYPFEDEEDSIFDYSSGMSPDVVDEMNAESEFLESRQSGMSDEVVEAMKKEAAFTAGRQTGMSDEVVESIRRQKSTGISEPLTTPVTKSGGSDYEGKGPKSRTSWLRYAPALGSAIGVFSDLLGLTNNPDYSNVSLIKDATDNIKPVGYTPLTTKLKYTPFDTQFYSSKLAEQNAATKRAIQNTAQTSGAAIAGLLASDYNTQGKMGDLFRQAEEYNQAQREKVAGFNRQTDAMNSEMAMKAAIANQSADELRLKSAITQAQMREQADATASAAKSANLTTMFDNLGAIGKENFIMDMLERNHALLYNWLGEYKGKACGGKINRRRRK